MRWEKNFTVLGCHACGEVGNVVTGGVVDVPGNTMFEKKEYLEAELDQIRQLLLNEPRGAPYVNANIILPACDETADLGYVIVESTEYPPMGHHAVRSIRSPPSRSSANGPCGSRSTTKPTRASVMSPMSSCASSVEHVGLSDGRWSTDRAP